MNLQKTLWLVVGLVVLFVGCELPDSLRQARARLQLSGAELGFQLGRLDSACQLLKRHKQALSRNGLKPLLSGQVAFFSARCAAYRAQQNTAVSYLGLALAEGYPLTEEGLAQFSEFTELRQSTNFKALFKAKGVVQTAEDYVKAAGATAKRLGYLLERVGGVVLVLLQVLQRLGLALCGFAALFLLALFLISFAPFPRGLFSFCTAFGLSLLAWLTVGFLALGWHWRLLAAPFKFLLLLAVLLLAMFALAKLVGLLLGLSKRAARGLWGWIRRSVGEEKTDLHAGLDAASTLRQSLEQLEKEMLKGLLAKKESGAGGQHVMSAESLLGDCEHKWQVLQDLLKQKESVSTEQTEEPQQCD